MNVEPEGVFKTLEFTDQPVRTEHWDGHEAMVVVQVDNRPFRGWSVATSVDQAYAGAYFDALDRVVPGLKRVGLPEKTVVAQNGHSHTDLTFPVGSGRLTIRQVGEVTSRDLAGMVADGVNAAIEKIR